MVMFMNIIVFCPFSPTASCQGWQKWQSQTMQTRCRQRTADSHPKRSKIAHQLSSTFNSVQSRLTAIQKLSEIHSNVQILVLSPSFTIISRLLMTIHNTVQSFAIISWEFSDPWSLCISKAPKSQLMNPLGDRTDWGWQFDRLVRFLITSHTNTW